MMKMLSTSIIALALLCIQCAQSFTTPLQSPLTFTGSRSTIAFSPIVKNEASLKMSSDEGEAPRRRRTRKDGKNTQSVEAKEPVKEDKVEQPAVTIPKVDPVQMQVADIRDVVAGKVPAPLKVAPVVEEEEEDDLEDDEEYEYYYEDENNNEVIVGTSTSNDNSLDALLADARKLREGEEPEVEDTSMKKQIKSVLSTIVTADFFVILALLAWFLAGIFCSYIIKDDTVQIAFNGIFQPVVQPALGILMIGSAAGAAFDESEDEY